MKLYFSQSEEAFGICQRPNVEETPEKLLNELPKGQGIFAETLRHKDGAITDINRFGGYLKYLQCLYFPKNLENTGIF